MDYELESSFYMHSWKRVPEVSVFDITLGAGDVNMLDRRNQNRISFSYWLYGEIFTMCSKTWMVVKFVGFGPKYHLSKPPQLFLLLVFRYFPFTYVYTPLLWLTSFLRTVFRVRGVIGLLRSLDHFLPLLSFYLFLTIKMKMVMNFIEIILFSFFVLINNSIIRRSSSPT